MEMTREMVKEIRESLALAVKEVEDKHGIGITIGNATYDQMSVKYSVEATILNGAESKEKADWDRLASRYGFKESDHGKEVTIGRDTFVLFSFNEKARKYPIVLKCEETGKLYKASKDQITMKTA